MISHFNLVAFDRIAICWLNYLHLEGISAHQWKLNTHTHKKNYKIKTRHNNIWHIFITSVWFYKQLLYKY